MPSNCRFDWSAIGHTSCLMYSIIELDHWNNYGCHVKNNNLATDLGILTLQTPNQEGWDTKLYHK